MTSKEPEHDKNWIIGCIKHDGFIKTDRGDKANQIILEALQAEPVKHGEWETGLLREFRNTDIEAQEKADKAGYVRYVVNFKCSACGRITMVENSIKYNYCPNCGAKMDGRITKKCGNTQKK